MGARQGPPRRRAMHILNIEASLSPPTFRSQRQAIEIAMQRRIHGLRRDLGNDGCGPTLSQATRARKTRQARVGRVSSLISTPTLVSAWLPTTHACRLSDILPNTTCHRDRHINDRRLPASLVLRAMLRRRRASPNRAKILQLSRSRWTHHSKHQHAKDAYGQKATIQTPAMMARV